VWVPGTETIVYTGENKGHTAVYYAEPTKEAGPKVLFSGVGTLGSLTVGPNKTIVFTRTGLDLPPVISRYEMPIGGSVDEVVEPNKALLAELDFRRPESVEVPVEGGVKMQMW